jgi:hypothetical protein
MCCPSFRRKIASYERVVQTDIIEMHTLVCMLNHYKSQEVNISISRKYVSIS